MQRDVCDLGSRGYIVHSCRHRNHNNEKRSLLFAIRHWFYRDRP